MTTQITLFTRLPVPREASSFHLLPVELTIEAFDAVKHSAHASLVAAQGGATDVVALESPAEEGAVAEEILRVLQYTFGGAAVRADGTAIPAIHTRDESPDGAPHESWTLSRALSAGIDWVYADASWDPEYDAPRPRLYAERRWSEASARDLETWCALLLRVQAPSMDVLVGTTPPLSITSQPFADFAESHPLLTRWVKELWPEERFASVLVIEPTDPDAPPDPEHAFFIAEAIAMRLGGVVADGRNDPTRFDDAEGPIDSTSVRDAVQGYLASLAR